MNNLSGNSSVPKALTVKINAKKTYQAEPWMLEIISQRYWSADELSSIIPLLRALKIMLYSSKIRCCFFIASSSPYVLRPQVPVDPRVLTFSRLMCLSPCIPGSLCQSPHPRQPCLPTENINETHDTCTNGFVYIYRSKWSSLFKNNFFIGQCSFQGLP